jgi:hypothetical protein
VGVEMSLVWVQAPEISNQARIMYDGASRILHVSFYCGYITVCLDITDKQFLSSRTIRVQWKTCCLHLSRIIPVHKDFIAVR